jgi:hypothetical protein
MPAHEMHTHEQHFAVLSVTCLRRDCPNNWQRRLFALWKHSQETARRKINAYNRLIVTAEHMNTVGWTVFCGEST